MKRTISFFTLLIFIIIGFFHNSMMAFVMQNNKHEQMMEKMGIEGMKTEKNDSNKSCCISVINDLKFFSLNDNFFDNKILKIKFISFIDIFSYSSRFLENNNLIKNTSPPNLKRNIKYYSYLDLIKIIKSNT